VLFPATSWNVIRRARQSDPESVRQALSVLLQDYAKPILAYIHQFGIPPHDAEDVAQDFMIHFFLEGLPGHGADPEQGRFRNYLRGALRHFLLNWRDREGAAKRRPAQPLVSLERLRQSSASLQIADATATPDEIFDREWGRQLLKKAVRLTRQQLAETGRYSHWVIFSRLVLDGEPTPSYQEVAEEVGVTESLVTNRLRAAKEVLRGALRTVVAETVDGWQRVEEELRDLSAFFR